MDMRVRCEGIWWRVGEWHVRDAWGEEVRSGSRRGQIVVARVLDIAYSATVNCNNIKKLIHNMVSAKNQTPIASFSRYKVTWSA